MSVATEIQRLQLAKEDIKSAIIEKGGTVEDGALVDSYGDAIRGIEENHIKYSTIARFEQDILPPIATITLDYVTSFADLFLNTPSLEEVTINSKATITNLNKMFYHVYFKKLRKINIGFDTSSVTDFRQSFSYIGVYSDKTVILEINGVLDLSSAIYTENMFIGSYALKEVRFKPKCIKLNLSFSNCQYLSDESIQSIIDGLADITGQTAQTITFHTNVKAKLTEEQIATITSKNWTLA